MMIVTMLSTTFKDDDENDDNSCDYMSCLDRHTKARKTNHFKKKLIDLEGFEDLKNRYKPFQENFDGSLRC